MYQMDFFINAQLSQWPGTYINTIPIELRFSQEVELNLKKDKKVNNQQDKVIYFFCLCKLE